MRVSESSNRLAVHSSVGRVLSNLPLMVRTSRIFGWSWLLDMGSILVFGGLACGSRVSELDNADNAVFYGSWPALAVVSHKSSLYSAFLPSLFSHLTININISIQFHTNNNITCPALLVSISSPPSLTPCSTDIETFQGLRGISIPADRLARDHSLFQGLAGGRCV